MKKILVMLLAGAATIAAADSFQDFNNNLYAQYSFISTNGGAGNNATGTGNVNQFGIGGTLQAKNNFWMNAGAQTGINNGYNTSDINLKAGYAFQFLNNEANGFQLIPYASFDTAQIGGPAVNGTVYYYGLGVKPEYRFMNALKVSLDAGVNGAQVGASTITGASNNGQYFGYYLTPEVQYDINKTVMLSVGYSYSNSFNSQSTIVGGSNGNNTFTAKVGYLF